MKQQTDSSQDIFELLEGGERLDMDPRPLYFGNDAMVPDKLRGMFYGIGGFYIVQGLDLFFE